MKKMIIGAVALMASIAVNAAAVSWGSDVITDPTGNVANKNVTGYLFVLSAAEYSTINSKWTSGKAEDLSTLVMNEYGKKTGSAAASGLTNKSGKKTLVDPADYAAGDTAYAVILYTYGAGDSMKYMGNLGTATFESAMDVDVTYMGNKLRGDVKAGATAWVGASSDVPEPTSGLLLLVGGAMLALRRKQK